MHHNFKDKKGEKFITNEGYEVEIIEYFGSRNSTIRFEDGTIVTNKEYGDLVKGTIKNPNHRTLYGVGYFGQGDYKSKDSSGKRHNYYETWRHMIGRCYDNEIQEKHPTYIGCSVVDEWHNFQVFAEWYENNHKENFQVDKDILFKGNKIYSPETCCFVPAEINSLFIKSNSIRGELPIGVSKVGNVYKATLRMNMEGRKSKYLGTFPTPELAFNAYKTAKEEYIKELADKWKNQITKATYEALLNYKVEITD